MEANNDSTGNEDPLTIEELTEKALLLVQQLHSDGAVNDDDRDELKGRIILSYSFALFGRLDL